jgi:hypothetical protein
MTPKSENCKMSKGTQMEPLIVLCYCNTTILNRYAVLIADLYRSEKHSLDSGEFNKVQRWTKMTQNAPKYRRKCILNCKFSINSPQLWMLNLCMAPTHERHDVLKQILTFVIYTYDKAS